MNAAAASLRIAAAVLAELRAHSEETYPLECCGVLLGRLSGEIWQVESAVRAANASAEAAHSRYEIAPAALVKIMGMARSQGREIAGFYHSHPDHSAQWSPTDLAEAHWIGCSYVITSVLLGKAAETNSFRLTGSIEENKRFEPETMRVD